LKSILSLILLITNLQFAHGQYLLLDEHLYSYIEYLNISNQYNPQFVLNQPYEMASEDSNLIKDIKSKGFQGVRGNDDGLHTSLFGAIGGTTRNEGEHILNLEGSLLYKQGNMQFVNQTGMDRSYLYDVKYPGELSESEHWIYGRVSNAYMQYSNSDIKLFLGRVARNWGTVAEQSLILSDNPYTYDHIQLSYNNSHIRLSILASQLNTENALSYNAIDSTIIPVQNVKRFLATHRLDIHLNSNLQLAFTETAIYGGQNATFDLSFLVPTNLYYDLQRNSDKPISGLWAMDIYYKPKQNWQIYLQALIDDFIINNDPGIDDRAKHPNRLGMQFKVSNANVLFEGLSTSLTYTKVWNHTYQSRDSWENYHFKGLRLGYPYAAMEELKIKVGYWKFDKGWLTCSSTYGRYGNIDVYGVFTLGKDSFPIPPVISSWSNNITAHFQLKQAFGIHGSIYHITPQNSPYAIRFSQKRPLMINLGFELNLSQYFNI
jgi:hypothetical protein